MSGGSFIDRRALFSSAAAAALLAATGVSAAGPSGGGRLRLALSGATRRDTWDHGNGLFMQVARQGLIFDTLTEVAADGTLRGELATDWTSAPDARVWTFELRDDVVFHDGTPLMPAHVVRSLDAMQGARVRVSGARRVTVTLKQPDTALPIRLSAPDAVIRHPSRADIGTGLYQVCDFVPGQRLRTKRVDSHYKDGSAGWFDEVELTSIPAERVRGQALGGYMVDAVDLTQTGDIADVPDITFQPDRNRPAQAISTDIGQPAIVSHLRPFDNLRAAERWWFS